MDAERVLADLRRSLQEHGALLNAEERAQVEAQASAVEQLASGSDHLALKDGIAKLDEVTRPFAERIMNKAIQSALHGHTVQEFEGKEQ